MVIKVESLIEAPDAKWDSILNRDTSSDGSFVYAVTTTGIYCKPSCPSRKPLRNNVVLFSLAELAQTAGFRACLRCEPDQHPSDDHGLTIVINTCRLISQSPTSPSLESLAKAVHTSPHHLQKLFTRVVGISPRQYADAHRLGTLKQALLNGSSVAEGVYEAGYGSSSRLYEKSSAQLGMTPATYRSRGIGMEVRYASSECGLGYVLVAATDKGICAVSLGEDEGQLLNDLTREFSAAHISPGDDAALADWLSAVLDQLSGKQPNAHLPLDVQATAFQRLVWQELQRIPPGQTSTYGQVARSLGRPTSARAVARACATNPAAVVIPCHRVVRGDGGMGGYKWGVKRKEALLEEERLYQIKP